MGMIWNKNGISTTDRFNAAASGPKLNDTKNIQAADTRESGNVLTPEQRESRNNTIKNTLVSQSFSGEIKAGKSITVNLPNGKYTVDFVKDPSTGGGRILVSHKGGSPDEAKAIIRAAQEVITGKPVSNTLPEYNKRINAESILSAGENPKEPLSKNTPILIGKTIIKSEIPESKSYLSALANRGVDSKLSTDDLSNIFKNIDENPNIKDKTAAKEEVVTYLKLDTESTRGKGPENTISKYLNKSEVERQPDIGTPGKPMVPSKPPSNAKEAGGLGIRSGGTETIGHQVTTSFGEPDGEVLGIKGFDSQGMRETNTFYLLDFKQYKQVNNLPNSVDTSKVSEPCETGRAKAGSLPNPGKQAERISSEEAYLQPNNLFRANANPKGLKSNFGIDSYKYIGLISMSGKDTGRAEGHKHRLLSAEELIYMATDNGNYKPPSKERLETLFSNIGPDLAKHINQNMDELVKDLPGLQAIIQAKLPKAGAGD